MPSLPNLALGVVLGRPGQDPGGTGSRLLAEVRRSGWPAGFLGADRGYTQALPERFHLPVRALGYSLVMDYKVTELGRQANSQGAVMVDGVFYCPAMPEVLVTASCDKRAGRIDEETFSERISARRAWRLVRKEGPDADGYERFACPAQGEHPHLCCPLRPQANALGKVPVLSPPAAPPKVCTQSAVTVAPDIGARHRQDLAFGVEDWARTYATYRNTIEGLERLREGPRPRGPRRTRAPTGTRHRRPEHLRRALVDDTSNAIANFEFEVSLRYRRGQKLSTRPRRKSTTQADIKGSI